MTWLYIAIAIAGAALTVLYFSVFGISHLIDYRPGSQGIDFFVGRIFKIAELKYERIESCEVRKLFDFGWLDGKTSTVFRTLTIGGWPRLTRVMLKLNRGLFRYIFLYPQNPSEFAGEVQRRLGAMSE